MKRLGTLSLLTISLWLAPTVLAQSQRLRFERLNVEDGLSEGSITAIGTHSRQDPRGMEWQVWDRLIVEFPGGSDHVQINLGCRLMEPSVMLRNARTSTSWHANAGAEVGRNAFCCFEQAGA